MAKTNFRFGFFHEIDDSLQVVYIFEKKKALCAAKVKPTPAAFTSHSHIDRQALLTEPLILKLDTKAWKKYIVYFKFEKKEKNQQISRPRSFLVE